MSRVIVLAAVLVTTVIAGCTSSGSCLSPLAHCSTCGPGEVTRAASSTNIGATVLYADGTLACWDCGSELVFGASEPEYHTRGGASDDIVEASANGTDAYLSTLGSTQIVHVSEDGHERWRVHSPTDASSPVSAAPEGVYVRGDSNTTLLAAADGSIVWSRPEAFWPDGAGGALGYEVSSGKLTAVDAGLAARWTKTLTTIGALDPPEVKAMIPTSNGTVWLVGYFGGSGLDLGDRSITGVTGQHAFLVEVDAHGATVAAFVRPTLGPVTVRGDGSLAMVSGSDTALTLDVLDPNGQVMRSVPIVVTKGGLSPHLVYPLADGSVWIDLWSGGSDADSVDQFTIGSTTLQGTRFLVNVAL